MTKMISVRLSEKRVAQIDRLVADGAYRSRAGLLTTALDRLFVEEERRRIDHTIVEGYTRIPPTLAEEARAAAAGERSIAAEPW